MEVKYMRVAYRSIKDPTIKKMNEIKQILANCRKKKNFEISDAYDIEVRLDEIALELLRKNVKIIEKV